MIGNFLQACLPTPIMCNCVALSCYLIFELIVNYEYLCLLSEIDCSIQFVKVSLERALNLKRKTLARLIESLVSALVPFNSDCLLHLQDLGFPKKAWVCSARFIVYPTGR